MNIYSEVSKISLEKTLNEMAGKEYSFIKRKLADLLVSEISPIGKEIIKLMNDKSTINILKKALKKQVLKLRKTLKIYVKKWA